MIYILAEVYNLNKQAARILASVFHTHLKDHFHIGQHRRFKYLLHMGHYIYDKGRQEEPAKLHSLASPHFLHTQRKEINEGSDQTLGL